MLAFWLSGEQIDIFLELCELCHADTPEKKSLVLEEMARAGVCDNVVQVKKPKEEYLKDLAKNFGTVLAINKGDLPNGNKL